MLADFCHGLWDTRIDSDTVSSEGYEVSNLISRDKFKKKRGFLAARFVKPVVTILVSFPFPVDLYAVNINPQVGAQKTCGLEMFSASLKSRNVQDINSSTVITTVATQEKDCHTTSSSSCPRITRNTSQRCQDISAFHLYEYGLNIDNVKQEFKNLFVQILRVRILEGNVGHFVNPCFQQNSQVHCDSKILRNALSNVHKCMLQHGHSLRSVSHLVIKITQVHQGSVPCLGAVEIFGQPAQNCHPFVMNYASIISSRLEREKQDVCNGLFGVAKLDNSLPSTNLTSGNEVSKSTPLIQNGENSVVNNVPDDFIDPITLNIMTLPVLLPSGTTIDHTTLEKHIASEKSWGRPPSDPFTGLPLGSKVVPNASLKYRIDNFLLSSDVDISNLGRTIGSLTDCQSTTKLKFNAVKQRNTLEKYGLKNKRTRGVDDSQLPLKRRSPGVSHFSDSLDQALEEALNVRRHPVRDLCNKNVSVSSLVPTYGSKANGSKLNLELENSADEVSHGCPHQEQSEKLFQLPCQHIICRGCLTHATEHNQCPNCTRNFDRKSIVRVHSVTEKHQ